MRKKAKYLHDAPNEALMPGVGGNHFSNLHNPRNGQMLPVDGSMADSAPGVNPHNSFYPGRPCIPTSYAVYPPTQPQGQMPPPLQESIMSSNSYGSQQSPISPTFQTGHIQQPSPLQSLAGAMQHGPQVTQAAPPGSYGQAFFDPSDPALFNFDLASLNFGNHYGALEFGMLGHMSSGAADTPPSDATLLHQSSGVQGASSYATPGTIPSVYSGSPTNPASYMYRQDSTPSDWPVGKPPISRQGSASNLYGMTGQHIVPSTRVENHAGPNAFTIGAGPGSLTSPSPTSSPHTMIASFDGSPATASIYPSNTDNNQFQHTQDLSAQQRQHPSKISTPNLQAQTIPRKRPRDPSTIYDSVKSPYSYTTGFHGLTAFLQRRFSPQKTLRIAKALASIRPSFISCTKTLNRDDLIFMEKCFQRTLWEYENFINACGTPTIVCRRTGEVAAVGKEFSILTGWNKDVLLGKEANLNINTGGSSGASSRGGFNTPRVPEGARADGLDGNQRPQPVFLAELLDDDSVIEFYEDFARLAFGDSRGSVTTRCNLLKYKTKDDPNFPFEDDDAARDGGGNEDFSRFSKRTRTAGNGKVNSRSDIAGEAGMKQLGIRDGKVECSYCWTVKRDVFDIPMLIVMNVCIL